MDILRARAYLDLLLGKDSRPGPDTSGGQDGGGPGPAGPDNPAGSSPAGPAASVVPAGFAGRINLTIPLATLLGLADRPGEIGGIGPIDPDLGANTPDRYQAITRDARSRCWLSITKVTPCQPDPHG